jgi:hypothetical protein
MSHHSNFSRLLLLRFRHPDPASAELEARRLVLASSSALAGSGWRKRRRRRREKLEWWLICSAGSRRSEMHSNFSRLLLLRFRHPDPASAELEARRLVLDEAKKLSFSLPRLGLNVSPPAQRLRDRGGGSGGGGDEKSSAENTRRARLCTARSTVKCSLESKKPLASRSACLFAVGGVVFQEGIKKRFFVALSFLSH